jgi:glycosyltransferase involved in cell wall biosynthesis
MSPLISICIPAYKRVDYLKRLLDSITIQTFRDFEVVITDDSNDASVSSLIENYRHTLPFRYQKNPVALGTPENWNESIRLAKGSWIKLMHDDDWFETPDALQQFAHVTSEDHPFIFSAYYNRYEAQSDELVRFSAFERRLLTENRFNIVAKNLVGPPSVTLYRKSALEYDKRMKWRVDIDFYIHYLANNTFTYIDKPLVNIGISAEQVTQSCYLVPQVEIPENMLLLKKIGIAQLRRWRVYDTWWRLMRNLKIRSITQFREAGYHDEVPQVIAGMISAQHAVPYSLLKKGLISKLLMFISLMRWKRSGGANNSLSV